MTRRTLLLPALAIAAIGAAAGLGLWRDRLGPPRVTAGGTLVTTTRSDPRTFNRLIARDESSLLVSLLTQAPLFRINRDSDDLEPWLAESWTASDDGLSYTVRLREGLVFSDGVPLTSADVVFSIEAARDERVNSVLAESVRPRGRDIQVEAADARTVIFRFGAPYAPGLRPLHDLPILPKHRLGEALREGRLRDAWGTGTPPAEMAGAGPFVLEAYAPGERLVFARNPRFWLSDEAGARLPYLDRLVIRIVPDQNTEILQLETAQVDFISKELRPEDYAAVRRAADRGRLRLFDLGPGLDVDYLWLNLAPNAPMRNRPWLKADDFRRAISHAVDRRAFADTVYLGLADPVHGVVTPANRRWYDPRAPRYEHDPDRARALLAGLGLLDRNTDGLIEDRQGLPVRFTILTQRGHTIRERAVAVIQEDLRGVGIHVDVAALEFGALVDRITRGDYEAVYLGLRASDTDPAVNVDFWLSSGPFHFWNPGQAKPATDWERRIDQLMAENVAAREPADRKAAFDEVQRVFGQALPAIAFAAPRIVVATTPRVLNVRPSVLPPNILWNAERLAIAPAPGT